MATKRVNADLEVVGEVISVGDNLNQKIAYLAHLLPEPPLPLDALEFEAGQVAGGVQAAHLASDPGAAYDYGMAPGDMDVPNVIRDVTPRLLTVDTDRFDRADEGEMKLIINGTLVETLDLTQAGDGGGHLREAGHALERIQIVPHNDFEPYKRGRMRIYIGAHGCDLRPGANRIRLEHEIDGALHGWGELDLFYDAGLNTPMVSTDPTDSLISAQEPATPAYLSGVRYLPAGAALHVKVTAENVFETTFHSQPVTIRGGQAGFTDRDVNFVAGGSLELSGYSDPPVSDEPFVVKKDIQLGTGFFSRDAHVTALARDPFTASTPVDIPRSGGRAILVNTKPQESTALIEKFTDERYRLPDGGYDTIPGQIADQWVSESPLSGGNAEVAGALIYPQTDYSVGHTPSTGQPNYSGFTGDQCYLRAFRDLNDPHNSGVLKMVGLALGDIKPTGDVKVEIKLPGLTGWLDLGLPFDAGAFTGVDGDGCRTSVNGDEFSWTAGVESTALSGWMVIVRVTLRSPAALVLDEMHMLGW